MGTGKKLKIKDIDDHLSRFDADQSRGAKIVRLILDAAKEKLTEEAIKVDRKPEEFESGGIKFDGRLGYTVSERDGHLVITFRSLDGSIQSDVYLDELLEKFDSNQVGK